MYRVKSEADVIDVVYLSVDRERGIDAADRQCAVAFGTSAHANRPNVVALVVRDELRKDIFIASAGETHHTTDLLELVKVGRLFGDGSELDIHRTETCKTDFVGVRFTTDRTRCRWILEITRLIGIGKREESSS